jgi:hypothetical protein
MTLTWKNFVTFARKDINLSKDKLEDLLFLGEYGYDNDCEPNAHDVIYCFYLFVLDRAFGIKEGEVEYAIHPYMEDHEYSLLMAYRHVVFASVFKDFPVFSDAAAFQKECEAMARAWKARIEQARNIQIT